MTLPQERTRAVNELGQAVYELMPFAIRDSRTGSALVPVEKLISLCGWLKHYPLPIEMELTARKCPELWGDL